MNFFIILTIGLTAGISSGLFGIGGAIIIVPMLTMFLHFPQKLAQGTTLVMFLLAPSFLASFQYFKNGNADIKTAAILWIGVFIGSSIGAWIINTLLKDHVSADVWLKRIFSIIIIYFALKMWQ